MTRALPIYATILATMAAGCRQAPPDTREADLAALRQADAAFEKEAAAKNVDGLIAYYADEAALFLSNAPTITGRDALRKAFTDMLSTPGSGLSWQATAVDVAKSGDLGYTTGAYQETATDPKGKATTDKGKYVTIWKKQSDGSWKVVVDIANSDLPVTP